MPWCLRTGGSRLRSTQLAPSSSEFSRRRHPCRDGQPSKYFRGTQGLVLEPLPSEGGPAYLCGYTPAAADALPGEHRALQAIFATRSGAQPLRIRRGSDSHPPSGAYPVTPNLKQRGAADLACGIGGFTYGCRATGWPVVFAVDKNGPAVEAYRALHGDSHRCVQADIFSADTLRLANRTKPAVLAMGFPCQPYSTAGARRGFSDPRVNMLVALLANASVLRPQALVLENVLGFATEQEGQYVEQLRYGLAILSPSFAMLAETRCLRSIRPLKRTRWLAVCPRQATWQNMTTGSTPNNDGGRVEGQALYPSGSGHPTPGYDQDGPRSARTPSAEIPSSHVLPQGFSLQVPPGPHVNGCSPKGIHCYKHVGKIITK